MFFIFFSFQLLKPVNPKYDRNSLPISFLYKVNKKIWKGFTAQKQIPAILKISNLVVAVVRFKKDLVAVRKTN